MMVLAAVLAGLVLGTMVTFVLEKRCRAAALAFVGLIHAAEARVD